MAKAVSNKNKKNVRRRSNWYIYFISFVAAFAILGMFILGIWDYFFPDRTQPMMNNQGIVNYVPGEELDVTILMMMSRSQGATPEQFMLLNYRPKSEQIVIVPLRPQTKIIDGGTTTGGTMVDAYNRGGAEAVMNGIKNTFGVECKFYVKFDRLSFINFTSLLGDTVLNIPFNIDDGAASFKSGTQALTATELYSYITITDFSSVPGANEDYRFVVMGSSLCTLINNHCKGLARASIQELFNKILNNADTNLTFKDYTIYQQALLYNSENSVNPATYFIPTGELNEQGAFVVSENSISTILNRFALD
ncbi:MAG: LCP family protein [Oscillospiraceae bacterium]|nr:LCP family protein [Oscillospiraceae bacterium]